MIFLLSSNPSCTRTGDWAGAAANDGSGMKIAMTHNRTIKHYSKRNTQMKITYSILGLFAGAALFLATGCGKQEPPAGETPKAMNPAPSDAQKAAAEAAPPAAVPAAPAPAEPTPPAAATIPVPAVPAAATQAVTEAAAAPSAMSAQTQGLIDKAKGLVKSEKYQEALNSLQQLKDMKLTDEQQKMVDDLKAQIQTSLVKAAGTNAASALGNILGGKK